MKNITLSTLFCLLTLGLQAQNISSGFSVFELNTTADTSKFYIPLTLNNISNEEIKLSNEHPTMVKIGQRTDLAFTKAIRIEKIKNLPLLSVVVDNASLPYAGNYEVSLSYSKGSGEPQFFNFSISRPAVTLAALNTISIIDECGSALIQNDIGLREMGNKGGTCTLQLSSPFIGNANSESYIKIATNPIEIKSGKDVYISYTIDRDEMRRQLSLGPHEGKLRVYNEQMSAAIEVPFKIIRKNNNGLIILTVISGLLFGLIVRHALTYKKEWEAAKFKAQQLIRELSSSATQIQDFEYNKGVLNLIAMLNAAMEGKSALTSKEATASLEEMVVTIRSSYITLRDDLTERLKIQQDLITPLEEVFNPGTLLPAFEHQTKKLKPLLELAITSFKASDAVSSAKHLRALVNAGNDFHDQFKSYILRLLNLFEDPEIYPAIMTTKELQVIASKTAPIKAELDALTFPTTATDMLDETLMALNRIQVHLTRLLNEMNSMISSIFEQADSGKANQQKFITAYTDWFKLLIDMADNTKQAEDPNIYWNPEALTKLNKVWTQLQNIGLSANSNLMKKAVDQLNRKASAQGLGKNSFSSVLKGLLKLPESAANKTIDRSRLNWWLYATVQTLIMAVLMSLAAYYAYSEAFIGTPREIIGLFLLSFSIDISVEGITKLKDQRPVK